MDLNKLSAYELIRREEIADIRSVGWLLRHKKSGARIVLLENDDDNKVFNIAFRTTPSDSTGVAHIMEHTVLCGSRKFPVKDPFVELAKGSMNTFLNAMTFPDKTMYPVASCNDRDFANLMEVYLDAVFYPNIYRKEEIFRQEGWHYQLEDEDSPIEYNGVVYNEMMGVFSSPDDVLEREILNAMFPESIYHHESGGDPRFIPDLTYEQYLDFHRTYYHPSNSYIYLYGAMDFEERLAWLDREYLQGFDRIEVDSGIGEQPAFEAMRTVRSEYPVGQEESEEDKTYLAYNAVVGTSLDTRLSTAFAVLSYVLLEAPGAPLKQALLDAGIGKDITSSYDSSILQPVFSVIAKEAGEGEEEEFLRTVRGTLEKIAADGIDQKALRAAINIMEFKFREADYGVYPRGLMYGIDIFDSWLYDEDKPFDYLRQLDDYAFLKEKIGTSYYEDLIRTWLLDNPHAALLILSPKKGLAAKTQVQLRKKLDDYKASLSKEEIAGLVEKTKQLRKFQEEPSSQEDLKKIPMLSREDLRREVLPLSNEIFEAGKSRIVFHDYSTNGIAYLQLLLDASGVPAEDLVWLGLLRNVLGFVDTEKHSYSDLTNEINLNTGGITVGVNVTSDVKEPEKIALALSVQARTLYDQIGCCFDLIREILFTSDLTKEKRLLEILRKTKSRLGTRLTEAGSATASTRCLSYFSQIYQMNECFGGIAFYDFLKDLEENYEERKELIRKKLAQVLETILSGGRFLVSYTGDRALLGTISDEIRRMESAPASEDASASQCVSASECTGTPASEDASASQCAPASECADSLTEAGAEQALSIIGEYPAIPLTKRNEGLRFSGKVQYVAQCGNFLKAGYPYSGAMKVLRTIMNFEYLWSNIRVVGGAYGCSGSFLRNGDTVFTSYRDPQLAKTFAVYEGVPEFLETFTVDPRDMTKYVIGTVSVMDTPLNANAKGSRSMNALLSGLSYEDLQKERDEVLDVSQEDIRSLAPAMKAVMDQKYICVLGNEDRINKEKERFMEVREAL